MGILNTLLQAAALGAQAKAQQDMGKRSARRMDKAHGQCTPCAAGAKVEAYQADARKRLGMKGAR
jgi:hypothetical protein